MPDAPTRGHVATFSRVAVHTSQFAVLSLFGCLQQHATRMAPKAVHTESGYAFGAREQILLGRVAVANLCRGEIGRLRAKQHMRTEAFLGISCSVVKPPI